MKCLPLIIGAVFCTVLFSACSDAERVEPESNNRNESGNTGIFGSNADPDHSHHNSNKAHEVEVVEVLNTSKYSYLRVMENGGEPYWIATMKAEFKEGQQLVYEGGLLKTDFKSTEHDRIFDKVYLVSKIGLAGGGEVPPQDAANETPKTVSQSFAKPDLPDLVDLSEIVNNAENFNGQMVKVYGEVVKVNPNIMDRNWLHIKDGTIDDFDFVLTSESVVPVGHAVVFEGTVALNRDFGAGYTYDLIMENAKVVR